MATPSAARPGRTIAALAVLTALIYGAHLLRGPGLDRQPHADPGREVQAAARPGPRGRHQRHPHAAAHQGLRAKVAEGLAEPGGLHHPQPGRQLRRRRVRGHDGRQQHRHLDPRQAGQEHPRHRAADRRAAVPPGPGQRRRVAPRRSRVPRRHRRPPARATPSTSPSSTASPSPTTSTNNAVVPKALRKAVSAATTPSPTPTAVGQRSRADRSCPDARRRRRDHPRPAAEVRSRWTAATREGPLGPAHSRAPTTRRSRWSPAARTACEKYILGAGRGPRHRRQGRSGHPADEQPGPGHRRLGGRPQLHRLRQEEVRRRDPPAVRRDGATTEPVRASCSTGSSCPPRRTNGAITDGNAADHRQLQPVRGHRPGQRPEVRRAAADLRRRVRCRRSRPPSAATSSRPACSPAPSGCCWWSSTRCSTTAASAWSPWPAWSCPSILTYGLVVLLGWQIGFRLSLAGIAGLIVAIGITADSFIVYFERMRDEVREGKTLRVARRDRLGRAPGAPSWPPTSCRSSPRWCSTSCPSAACAASRSPSGSRR